MFDLKLCIKNDISESFFNFKTQYFLTEILADRQLERRKLTCYTGVGLQKSTERTMVDDAGINWFLGVSHVTRVQR